MTVALVKTLATDLFEYKNLISSCVICEHRSLDHCTLNIRSADLYLALVIHEKDFVELHSCTFRLRKTVAKDFIACLNFELLACNINNSVHKNLILHVSTASGLPLKPLMELDGHQMDRKYRNYYSISQMFSCKISSRQWGPGLMRLKKHICFREINHYICRMDTTFTYDRQVTGKEFVGRKAEKDFLKAALSCGKNISIYEPAKTGKSSLLKQSLMEAALEGRSYTVVDVSLLSVRTFEDFIKRFTDAVSSRFSHSYDKLNITELTDEDILQVLSRPVQIAGQNCIPVVIVFSEFQNILNVENAEHLLKLLETVSDNPQCSWIWTGSQVNRMKHIFEKVKFFYRNTTRLRISDITAKEAETFINKGFLKSGKVIEKQQIEYVYDIFKGNVYYLHHFAATCDALSRGFITQAVVEESIISILSIHEPRFISTVYDLTDFQMSLLKAILDGEYKFSSASAIEKYSLNSSANVKRLKEALCKKEIITFEKDGKARLLDPLFEYWLRKFYF